MLQSEAVKRLKRSHGRSLERLVKQAYQAGVAEGVARARGAGRRGRTIRGDATVEGLIEIMTRHFGLDRYAFEVRVVHPRSGRRVPARDHLRDHLGENGTND